MLNFNPNAAASKESGIFGLPFTVQEAQLVLLPVPWEVTTSYGGGTSLAPKAIFDASKQVDLFDLELGNFYEAGIAMLEISKEIEALNAIARKAAESVIHESLADVKIALHTVNSSSLKLNDYVYTETKKLLLENKLVGIIGGDHSTPYGAICALLENYPDAGILHFDAHADLRNAYEGFEHSHASIMYNVITKTKLKKLIQVGIRDFCEEEYNFIQEHSHRIKTFFDKELFEKKMQGVSWSSLCDEIIGHLPNEVYISFDIDGLDPRYCPHTGTPVPGGLDFQEAIYLIKKVTQSGRTIIGFDLNEVSPGNHSTDEWDANVGARLLYKMCGYTLLGKR
jgi:agmatinase